MRMAVSRGRPLCRALRLRVQCHRASRSPLRPHSILVGWYGSRHSTRQLRLSLSSCSCVRLLLLHVVTLMLRPPCHPLQALMSHPPPRALVITSHRAASAFAAFLHTRSREEVQQLVRIHVYAVGKACWQPLAPFGFTVSGDASGNAATLAAHICETFHTLPVSGVRSEVSDHSSHAGPTASRLTFLCGSSRLDTLPRAMAEAGIVLEEVEVYTSRSMTSDELQESLAAAMRQITGTTLHMGTHGRGAGSGGVTTAGSAGERSARDAATLAATAGERGDDGTASLPPVHLAFLFMSPSGVRAYMSVPRIEALLRGEAQHPPYVLGTPDDRIPIARVHLLAIGSTTAKAIQDAALPLACVCDSPTADGAACALQRIIRDELCRTSAKPDAYSAACV
ncbi:hypothetical protein EON66_08055 [archaeon]|nr:MAG: hypothetical protein EON66_08055 [archaeon]